MFSILGIVTRAEGTRLEGELVEAVGYYRFFFRCRPVGLSEITCVLLLNT